MNNLPNSTQNENNDDQKIETKLSIETVNTSPSQQRIKKVSLISFTSSSNIAESDKLFTTGKGYASKFEIKKIYLFYSKTLQS